MAEFPYTPSPKNVTEFFNTIQSIGVPKTKVTVESIKSYGFSSSNDRYLIGVLKSLRFLSADNLPTERWQAYRTEAGPTMASGIKDAYSGLLETYEDAYKRDDNTLNSYFKANTKVGDRVVELMLKTFRNLCALADFGAISAEAVVPEPLKPPKEEAARIPTVTTGLTVNINIQLTLPATDDESVYDKLFASLKRNLFP